MFKRFIKDSAIYGVTNIFANGISFLLIPVYTRVLLPADFGVYDVTITLISILSLVFPLEVGQGLFRYLPEIKSKKGKSGYISSAIWLALIAYLIFIALFLPFSQSISIALFETKSETSLIIVSILSIIFLWLYTLGNLTLRSLQKTFDFSIIDLALSIATLIFTILFVLVFKAGAMGIILGYFSGYLVATILSIFSIKDFIVAKININNLKEMLKFSLPLIPSSLGSLSTFYITRLMIKVFMTVNEVGIYGIAYKLIAPITLIINITAMTTGQLIYNNYRSKEAPAEIANIMSFFASICLLITAVITIFSKEIIRLMTTPIYYSAAYILPLVALSAFINGLAQFTFGLNIAKKTRVIAIINITMGLINIGLNYLLIPPMGLIGAGIATCVSVSINFVVSMIFSQKNYFIPYAWKKLIFAFILSIFIITLSTFLKQVDTFTLILKGFLVLILIVILLLLKTITRNDLSIFSLRNLFNFLKLRIRNNP